jgi:Ice-binding-like
MSKPTNRRRLRRACIALGVSCAFIALPAAAQAQSRVDLATASPFVVLGGQAVTNTGPSVLYGDLGVSPGTNLSGFGAPAVVNGATHNNDAVAAQAQLDLTNAYNVAAGQPVSGANDLTGQDLGGKRLNAGAYRYTSDAQLTGTLTLDAQGDPNAQFVFQVASALTTASASRVVLINGASPCNVYWQIGSSATLGSTTQFQGNLMALTSISLNNGAVVFGRMLARNGQVSLINNVLDGSRCGIGSGGPSGIEPSGGDGSSGSGTTRRGTAVFRRGAPGPNSRPRGGPGRPCVDGFRGRVRGRMIERVVFRLDGRRIARVSRSPFRVFIRATPGAHRVTARVTFTDRTRARTLRMRYRACASQVLRPRRGPAPLTG